MLVDGVMVYVWRKCSGVFQRKWRMCGVVLVNQLMFAVCCWVA
ncbi:hypothetical protein Patl1_27060 [Pistacia atlantica]|uniref:Uncharacterized protein n=1 Tax=Pistacia atlantica TaxID=434234 RepID=A0ACC1B518_9ROSI|nr:hypothetical protein Patl1_27060 [Pistacia atlantica]